MVQNTYLFLIDYVKSLLEYPIINGLNMTFFILLWQGIGTFVRTTTKEAKYRSRLFYFNFSLLNWLLYCNIFYSYKR